MMIRKSEVLLERQLHFDLERLQHQILVSSERATISQDFEGL